METYIRIDFGGTFTDCAVIEAEDPIVNINKAPTTRAGPAQGVLDAVAAAAELF